MALLSLLKAINILHKVYLSISFLSYRQVSNDIIKLLLVGHDASFSALWKLSITKQLGTDWTNYNSGDITKNEKKCAFVSIKIHQWHTKNIYSLAHLLACTSPHTPLPLPFSYGRTHPPLSHNLSHSFIFTHTHLHIVRIYKYVLFVLNSVTTHFQTLFLQLRKS